jgi:hypothetical protein
VGAAARIRGGDCHHTEAAGAGAVGSAAGGLLIGAIINSQVGGIYFGMSSGKDAGFTEGLLRLVGDKVPLDEVRQEEGSVRSGSVA